MNYTDSSKPGMGDPYWYEWSIGLQYIIDMLLPENNIKYVELQANVGLGLDDVVVTYSDNSKLFIQVKHTRVDDTLTFGDIVSADEGDKNGRKKQSLLKELAQSWNAEKEKYEKTKVCLLTNRKGASRGSSTRTKSIHKRPPLIQFWPKLKQQCESVQKFEEISFPEYEAAWEEWKEQLIDIPTSEDKLSFLRCLEIEADKPGLSALEKELLNKIAEVFQTNKQNADILLGRLDHALRKWTTSNRETSCVSDEDVLDALSGGVQIQYFNHDLIPNEPFFKSRETLVETIESNLKDDNNRIIFLSGIPGTGKTNIISKLSAKRNSLIDIRYYAYEPIDPSKEYHPMDVSKRVEKECFWNELFNQLRKKLRGQLKKYNVPVINDLLTLEQMKTKFFEIASAYAKDRGECFIIAIDGIDHAARALHIDETFLPSLPYPAYLPENVKIILAGQPKEGYSNYPVWLFNDKENVKQIDIPSLQNDDIQDLVNAHFNELLPSDTRNQMADVIIKYANGNTLSAIFAIYEAKQHRGIIELEEQLKNRKLSGNITEYYQAIWEDAISKIGIPFVDYKIAGALALFNESISEDKLSKIFVKENISESTWKNVLKTLMPLLIENEGNYSILHNDVRVFLSGIIAIDNDHVKEVYGNLADYYLCLSQKESPYFRDIYRFLKSADRIEEFKSLFTPDYIIQAYVYGIELEELKETANELLEDIIAKNPINWAEMRDLSFSYLTISQIEKSSYEIEDVQFRKTETHIAIHPFECFVEAESSWSPDLITDVLSLCEKLYDNGYTDRAIQLFHRWFSGVSILRLCGCIESTEEDREYSSHYKTIAIIYGKCVVFANSYSILNDFQKLNDMNTSFAFYLQDSIVKNTIKENTSEKLSERIKQIDIIYQDTLLFCIRYFLNNNRITDIAIIEEAFHEKLMRNASGILLSTFMRIVSSDPNGSLERNAEIRSAITSIQLPDLLQEENMLYCSIYGFVYSYLHSSKSYEESAHIVLGKFMESSKNYSAKYFGVFFNNICLLGTWFSCNHRKVETFFRPGNMKRLMEALLFNRLNPTDGFLYTSNLYSIILKAFIFLSQNSNAQIKEVVDDVCNRLFSNYPVYNFLDSGFYFYKNNKEKLQDWMTYWLGETGRVWQEKIGDRNRIIFDLSNVKRLYDAEDCIDMSYALDRAKWSVIGFASHKEYACDNMLNWYNEIVEQNDHYVTDYAIKIKEISDKIQEVGDNRIEHILNSKIYTDLFGLGHQTAIEIMRDNHYLSQCLEEPGYLVDGLIGLLKKYNYNKEKLLEIWSTGMALLDWREDSNQATILSLQRAIEICAKRSGIEKIYDILKEYGPAYVDQNYDPIRFIIPQRWCDPATDSCQKDLDSIIIDEYITQNTKIEKNDLLDVINKLISKKEINDEKLSQLLFAELKRSEYSIERNSLIEFLIKKLPNNYSDKIIGEYLLRKIKTDDSFSESDTFAFSLWQIEHQDESYKKEGMEKLIQTNICWLTAAGHFQQPEFSEQNDYEELIEWSTVDSIESLYYQVIRIIIQSEDQDAVRTALAGLFALMRTDDKYILFIERDWHTFHYCAKEWLCMVYELLWYYAPCKRDLILKSIKKHCEDEEFNVALYANMLLEDILGGICEGFQITKQPFFESIPQTGKQNLIKTKSEKPWITGNGFVHRALELFEIFFYEDYSDIELRTVAYLEHMKFDNTLISLHRNRIGGYKVVLEKTNYAFFRVLYKDWYEGRWKGLETDIGRIILSSSEPYCVLISPQPWKNNHGYIIENTEEFVNKTEDTQRKIVEELLNLDINEDEMIIAGNISDFTHDREILGFSLCYLDFPFMKPEYAKYTYEINSRALLQNRADFSEGKHLNISLHHNGIESFLLSGISCGLSKKAIGSFNWIIKLSNNGFFIFNRDGIQIGRFEYYYGQRNISNRYSSRQPILQRWIVKKKELAAALQMIEGKPKSKMVTEVTIRNV